MESFYTDYDNWCRNLWDGQFYVKWLKRNEFFESIKTYGDWNNLQKEVNSAQSAGLIGKNDVLKVALKVNELQINKLKLDNYILYK